MEAIGQNYKSRNYLTTCFHDETFLEKLQFKTHLLCLKEIHNYLSIYNKLSTLNRREIFKWWDILSLTKNNDLLHLYDSTYIGIGS